MPRREMILVNKRGLHARAATKLVQCCQAFDANVTVNHNDRNGDARNIMSLLMLAAPCGSRLIIDAEGSQAEEALAAIEVLIAARFEEEP